MKKKSNAHGITFVSLVIAIIVVLILAGVTISGVGGENGIIKKAILAKEMSEEKARVEKIEIAEQSAYIQALGDRTKKIYIDTLKEKLGEENVKDSDDNDEIITFPITVLMDGNIYEIDKNGNVIKTGTRSEEMKNWNWTGKQVMYLGDSLTEPLENQPASWQWYSKGYYSWVDDLLGTTNRVNYASSGASFATYSTTSYSPTSNNIYSQAVNASGNPDLIVVMGGTNDQTWLCDIGSSLTENDTRTTYGAINMIAKTLKEKFPNAKIVFITPHYQNRFPESPEDKLKRHEASEYAEIIKEICAKYNIPVYDNNKYCGINESNIRENTGDYNLSQVGVTNTSFGGCHWNDTMHSKVGHAFAQWLVDTFGGNLNSENTDIEDEEIDVENYFGSFFGGTNIISYNKNIGALSYDGTINNTFAVVSGKNPNGYEISLTFPSNEALQWNNKWIIYKEDENYLYAVQAVVAQEKDRANESGKLWIYDKSTEEVTASTESVKKIVLSPSLEYDTLTTIKIKDGIMKFYQNDRELGSINGANTFGFLISNATSNTPICTNLTIINKESGEQNEITEQLNRSYGIATYSYNKINKSYTTDEDMRSFPNIFSFSFSENVENKRISLVFPFDSEFSWNNKWIIYKTDANYVYAVQLLATAQNNGDALPYIDNTNIGMLFKFNKASQTAENIGRVNFYNAPEFNKTFEFVYNENTMTINQSGNIIYTFNDANAFGFVISGATSNMPICTDFEIFK